jgi:CheY-like chemotaxis protein
MGGTLGYRDAVVLLGMDPPAVAALDRALGGALSLATGGASDKVLSIVDAQGRIVGLGLDLVRGLRDRLRGVRRVERTRRLEAAHAVIVVTAYFEALAEAQLPFAVSDLELTRQEQMRLAGASAQVGGFLDALLTAAPPRPAAHLPYERFLGALRQWYAQLSARLVSLASGLAVWDGLDDTSRAQAERMLSGQVCDRAVGRFGELYSQLARDIPEFGFWSGQIEHQATRAEIRRALADVESMLVLMSPGGPPVDAAAALSRAYRAALPRPILTEGEVPAGICLPTLDEGYLNPDFRVRPVVGGDWPADEAWWSDVPVRSDLTEYLAAALTSPEATTAPLVVLGQPGAGKSALTKILAARLPAADFLPVRVVLREASAEDGIQEQIEYAIRAATGEHLPWPRVAGAAGGALPVVLLDGFDELLQATSVSQSDYLLKVARFQQREADQDRPVVVLVTSRTAVADRARYPEGAVALRLEPFRPAQAQSWLEQWNSLNETYLAARGLSPLPASVVARHEPLACQPLLLMMLALYDAGANALQRGYAGTGDGQPLDETALYEKLLTAFAEREVAKTGAALPDRDTARQVERELQRLSLVAFGIINRHRQWITEAELEADLAALLETRPASRDDFKAPLTQADVSLGRFFFIQRAQAVREGTRLQTYEFLHATFAEYLAARLAVQLAASLLTHQEALTVGPAVIHDDLLYALLSFAPLSSRQLLRFVRGECARQIAPADRHRLAGLLIGVLTESTSRTGNRHAGYQPTTTAISSRHGIYSANLVLLILVLSPSVTAGQLFPGSDDPAGTWKRRTLLWRSSLTEAEWTDLALAMDIRHIWDETTRDLEIRLAGDPPGPPEPVDLYWLQGYPPGHEARGHRAWYRGYWHQINHKMDVAGGTNDSFIRHALEPVFRWLGPALTSFAGIGSGPATSAAYDLLNVWLTSTLSGPDGLAAAYEHFGVWAEGLPPWDAQTRSRVQALVLDCLSRDASRLPAATVVRVLRAIIPPGPGAEPAHTAGQHIHLVLQAALAALSAGPEAEQQAELTSITATAAEVMRRDPAATLQTWITLHHTGLPLSAVFGDDPGEFLDRFPFAAVADTRPELVRQAQAIAAARYGITLPT